MSDVKKEIKVKFQEQMIGGTYANALHISHTGEEFILDFLLISPPTGTVNSRIITSPGHMKRIISAMEENVKNYETKYGEIKQAAEPEAQGRIGFLP
jgi:hypothetical protein